MERERMLSIFRRTSLTKKEDGASGKTDETDLGSRYMATFDEKVPILGFKFDTAEGRFVVKEVLPKSAAAERGIANGDELVEINDKDAHSLSRDEATTMLTQRPLKVSLARRPLVVATVTTLPPSQPTSTTAAAPAPPTGTKADTRAAPAATLPANVPTINQKYDVLHRVALDDEIRAQPAVPPAEIPPEPLTGWRWRPCLVHDVGMNKQEKTAYVEFLDVLQGYPREALVLLGEKGQYLAPFGLRSPSHVMHHNYRSDDILDVLDIYPGKHSGRMQQKWRKCQVVAVAPYYIRVMFSGWNRAYDIWIHVLQEDYRLAPFGVHTEQEEQEEFNREKDFRNKMLAKGMKIVDVEGDGNCLFRAVSLLLYGDEFKHAEIRKACCDYMESQSQRFEFLVEEGSSFKDYLEVMRKDKAWGDEPELRVIEELYDRPISMFSCDIVGMDAKVDVTEPLAHYRVGEEVLGLEKVEPLRLSFHGNNHYNAVIKLDSPPKYEPNPEKNPGRIRRHRLQDGRASMSSLRRHTSSFSVKRSNSTVSNIGK